MFINKCGNTTTEKSSVFKLLHMKNTHINTVKYNVVQGSSQRAVIVILLDNYYWIIIIITDA